MKLTKKQLIKISLEFQGLTFRMIDTCCNEVSLKMHIYTSLFHGDKDFRLKQNSLEIL